MGRKLNLSNPRTFNEKLQWLKLYYYPYDQLAINCTDKYLVRDYIERKGLGQYLNEIYGVWDKTDEVNWDLLPDKFVLKCTHGCGYNILCEDKKLINSQDVMKRINGWLKEDFGAFNVEPHYSSLKGLIICEKFLGGDIIDYKYFCFNGKLVFMYIAQGFGKQVNERITFFDDNGHRTPYKRTDYPELEGASLPMEFERMKELSLILASDFPFVRVDWFEVDGVIYFSEMTFTPCGAMMKIDPPDYDKKLGELLDISQWIEEKK